MKSLTPQVNAFRRALESAAPMYGIRLEAETMDRLSSYYEFLAGWNPRLHLVAPCSPEEFATRHVLESLLLLPHLPESSRIADIGSGAGLPIIPCLISRYGLRVILIESSVRKCVFLRECLRGVSMPERVSVISERFEEVPTPEVDVVTCRALDRFSEMFSRLVDWSPKRSTLMLFGSERLARLLASAGISYSSSKIPGSDRRFLFIASKR